MRVVREASEYVMKVKISIRAITRPSGLAMSAVFVSFLAWLCPDFGILRKGFTVAERPGLLAYFILLSWYLLIFASFKTGQALGTSLAPRRPVKEVPPLESLAIYRAFTLLAAFGTISTLIRIFQVLSVPQAILFLYLGRANLLKNTLYENYSAGVLSLRYIVVYSASLAIYRTIKFKKVSLINVANILLLAGTVLISSRLILIATLLISFFLVTYGRGHISISVAKLCATAAILFAMLSLLNSSRNSNFYANRNLSLLEASISEIVTYLGAPFHVSIGAARRLDELTSGGPETYREFIDIEPELTTNSAFVHLHERLGYICWAYIAAACCGMGFVFCWLTSLGRTCLLLPCGAILYGSAELWRLDLFHQGIFVVWLVFGIGVPGAFLLLNKLRLPSDSGPRPAPEF